MNLITRLLLYGTVLGLLYSLLPTGCNRHHVELDLPAYGEHGPSERRFPAIIKISSEDSACSATVVDDNYILTAAHCVNGFFSYYKKPIKVLNELNVDTGVQVRVVAIYTEYDIAILKGDLTAFDYKEIESYSPVAFNREYVSCGYPSIQARLSCVPFVPTHNSYFMIGARGFLIKGMSGGPVLDPLTGKVVGVNSAASTGFVIAGPTFGILGLFGME